MRERLIELIKESFDKPKYEFYTGGRNCAKGYVSAKTIADYLLANGVIVPPCAVGEIVWIVRDGVPVQESIFFRESDILCLVEDGYVFGTTKLEELKGE